MHTIVASAGWLVGVDDDTPVSAPRKWGPRSGAARGGSALFSCPRAAGKKGEETRGEVGPPLPLLPSLFSSPSRALPSPLSPFSEPLKNFEPLLTISIAGAHLPIAPRPCAHAGFARARAAQRTVYTAWGVRLHLCVRATLAVMVAAAKSAGKRSTKPVERLVSGELPAAPPSPTRRNVHHVTESPWTSAKLRARLTCYSHPPARPPT